MRYISSGKVTEIRDIELCKSLLDSVISIVTSEIFDALLIINDVLALPNRCSVTMRHGQLEVGVKK